ncbi:hypothetical protein LTR09_003664 [Extremus antarcticus]|uniref:Nuclear pore complex protein Nup85 n=1 Tax=Extremus antarcticus TaxID=702011 RepID=A0AAJ0DQT7_9PEZI|nr:hypothetical protein LTR09_003664 [Extremus antarcticus]
MAPKMSLNFGHSPATPNRKGKASLFSQAPSTTPAGPPPSYLTNPSTTPAGEPPRSSKLFGSSYNPAQNTFGHRNTPARKGRPTFAVPESSPPEFTDEFDDDAPGEELSPERGDFVASTIESSPRGLKRSRNGQVREQESSGMAEIARAFTRDAGPAKAIEGPDDVVLGTEEVLASLDVAMHQQQQGGSREGTITEAVTDLTRLWTQHTDDKTLPGAVGPDLDDALTKATYLSTLLLQLHNPHTTKPVQQQQRSALRLASQQQSTAITLPRALLEWLNAHHNPLPDEFNDLHMHRPSPAAHEAFWDILGADIIRGRFTRVIKLLRDAGWENATTAAVDYEDEGARGYRGQQLHNTREVVDRCIRVMESCPAVTDDDLHVPGPAWSVFRQRVRHALRELEAFASAFEEDLPAPPKMNMFANSNASMAAATARAESRVPPTIYQSLRGLYGVLLGGNGILDYAQDWVEASILLTVWWDGEESNTALNASIADLGASRSGLRKSMRAGGNTREVDIAPLVAYRRRLGDMFRIVPSEVDEPTFQPDTLDPLHVGLAVVFEDDVAEAIDLVRAWSHTVASAVVEIAALGGWLPIPEGRPNSRGLLGRGFSTDDLLVLSHGPGARQLPYNSEGIVRDDVLTSYAALLAEREKYVAADGKIEREGWEVAISVLGRLDDTKAAEDRIRALLEAMEVEDEPRVEKVLAVCAGMGFEQLGRGIAERYADALATHTPVPYGSTLIYYARAHALSKIRETLSLLISLSLLHSAAMPPQQNLDPHLSSLLSAQRTALVDLAEADTEAAEILGRSLSGYALLRHFYDLRDATSTSSGSGLVRKRSAAKTLVSIISSASDCIRGGLFDPEVESVVPVEGLLILLGEVLPLLGHTSSSGKVVRVLEMKQLMALMGVIEDYEQVSGRIREGGEGLLGGSMGCFRSSGAGGMGGSGGSASLKKSMSGLSGEGMMGGSGSWQELAESSWSLLQPTESLESEGSKKKTVEIQRGWDWRKGLDAVAGSADVGSREVVMLLRTALAREVGRSWGNGWA